MDYETPMIAGLNDDFGEIPISDSVNGWFYEYEYVAYTDYALIFVVVTLIDATP